MSIHRIERNAQSSFQQNLWFVGSSLLSAIAVISAIGLVLSLALDGGAVLSGLAGGGLGLSLLLLFASCSFRPRSSISRHRVDEESSFEIHTHPSIHTQTPCRNTVIVDRTPTVIYQPSIYAPRMPRYRGFGYRPRNVLGRVGYRGFGHAGRPVKSFGRWGLN